MIAFITEYAPLIGLLFFFFVFVGIALISCIPSYKQKIESYKYIPLSEDHHDHG